MQGIDPGAGLQFKAGGIVKQAGPLCECMLPVEFVVMFCELLIRLPTISDTDAGNTHKHPIKRKCRDKYLTTSQKGQLELAIAMGSLEVWPLGED